MNHSLPETFLRSGKLQKSQKLSAPGGTRTYNLLIKSQLLYRLSYKGLVHGLCETSVSEID